MKILAGDGIVGKEFVNKRKGKNGRQGSERSTPLEWISLLLDIEKGGGNDTHVRRFIQVSHKFFNGSGENNGIGI